MIGAAWSSARRIMDLMLRPRPVDRAAATEPRTATAMTGFNPRLTTTRLTPPSVAPSSRRTPISDVR